MHRRAAQQCLGRSWRAGLFKESGIRANSSDVKHRTDDCGIPLRATWSVHELLSSYPKPTVSSETLVRLHKLAALRPPTGGTAEHDKMKTEVEELIRLVEAVKLVDTDKVHPAVHQAKEGVSYQHLPSHPSGRELLQHASRTSDGFYIVDSEKGRPKIEPTRGSDKVV